MITLAPIWNLMVANRRLFSDNIKHMDVISHILLGKILSFFGKKTENKIFWVLLFSIAADIILIPFYIFLGKENGRFLWVAQNQDWAGASLAHPFLTGMYDTTHSIIFLLLIIFPIVLFFRLPKMAFFVYFFHIVLDIFTHTGEWAIKIIYPLNFKIGGFSDAWAWPVSAMAVCWIILSAIIFLTGIYYKNVASADQN